MGTLPTNEMDLAETLADMQMRMLALADQNQSLGATLHGIEAGIQTLVKMFAHEYMLGELHEPAVLMAGVPFTLDRQGRRHMAIFSPVVVNNIAVNMMGVAGYVLTLNAGWNIINAPNGTVLMPGANTNQAVVIKVTNHTQAGAI